MLSSHDSTFSGKTLVPLETGLRFAKMIRILGRRVC